MQNPGLQIEIPQVNEDALLEEPMNNNGMSVNSQATIVTRRGNNNSNSENGLSVYEEENVEMEGGKRLRQHKKSARKSMKKTRKGKKISRKTVKKARKAKKAKKSRHHTKRHTHRAPRK
jgi:predicted ribosome quality control (RQC) complex YloA/Tae2 family protein